MFAEIWHKLATHPQFFAMLTIPFVTAVVTWAHVWMALKMLFYPIHFWGIKIQGFPGGGIGSSSPNAIHDKRALVKEVSDTLDSSTYYDAAAEKEAEELALVLDAASENVAEIEGADDDVKVNR